MTSNLGSHLIRENMEKANEKDRENTIDVTRNQVLTLLRQTIRPEFLNRIDEIIMFNPLTREEIIKVVNLQVEMVTKMLEKNNIHLRVTEETIRWLANEGYDPQFGARPVKRVIQRELLNRLSKMILGGEVDRTCELIADNKGNELVIRNR